MPRINEISIPEIALAENLDVARVRQLFANERGAPKAIRKIGQRKIFDARKVLAFFEARRRKFAKSKKHEI